MEENKIDWRNAIKESSLNTLGLLINTWAEKKGWNEDVVLSAVVANLHSEIIEAWEEIRNGRGIDEVYYSVGGKPEGFGIEIADLIIRVLHLISYFELDIERMMANKMEYNETRPYRHGNKKS